MSLDIHSLNIDLDNCSLRSTQDIITAIKEDTPQGIQDWVREGISIYNEDFGTVFDYHTLSELAQGKSEYRCKDSREIEHLFSLLNYLTEGIHYAGSTVNFISDYHIDDIVELRQNRFSGYIRQCLETMRLDPTTKTTTYKRRPRYEILIQVLIHKILLEAGGGYSVED